MAHAPKTTKQSGGSGDMTLDEVLDCCKDPNCKDFVESELKSQGVSTPQGVGADFNSLLTLFFTLLPQVVDVIRKWRDQQSATATP